MWMYLAFALIWVYLWPIAFFHRVHTEPGQPPLTTIDWIGMFLWPIGLPIAFIIDAHRHKGPMD